MHMYTKLAVHQCTVKQQVNLLTEILSCNVVIIVNEEGATIRLILKNHYELKLKTRELLCIRIQGKNR